MTGFSGSYRTRGSALSLVPVVVAGGGAFLLELMTEKLKSEKSVAGPHAQLIRIVAPHFVAGLIVEVGRVQVTAPILGYMMGWTLPRVVAYARGKGWRVQRISR